MLDKLDKKWIGFIVGLIFPAFCFLCYWAFFHSQIGFPIGFINYLRARANVAGSDYYVRGSKPYYILLIA